MTGYGLSNKELYPCSIMWGPRYDSATSFTIAEGTFAGADDSAFSFRHWNEHLMSDYKASREACWPIRRVTFRDIESKDAKQAA